MHKQLLLQPIYTWHANIWQEIAWILLGKQEVMKQVD
jgi:hypothetical protein